MKGRNNTILECSIDPFFLEEIHPEYTSYDTEAVHRSVQKRKSRPKNKSTLTPRETTEKEQLTTPIFSPSSFQFLVTLEP